MNERDKLTKTNCREREREREDSSRSHILWIGRWSCRIWWRPRGSRRTARSSDGAPRWESPKPIPPQTLWSRLCHQTLICIEGWKLMKKRKPYATTGSPEDDLLLSLLLVPCAQERKEELMALIRRTRRCHPSMRRDMEAWLYVGVYLSS